MTGLLVEKALLNLRNDAEFLRDDTLPLQERIRFIADKYVSMTLGRRRVTYLTKPFVYDNRWMPALLQNYPREIEELGRFVPFDRIRTVFDIGANVGQFGRTLLWRHPHLELHSFEPNPGVFELLRENAAGYPNWWTYDCGLGSTRGAIDFYFVEGKSAQGSVYAGNASLHLLKSHTKSLKVQVEVLDEPFIAAHHLPQQVGLLKVDVEGYEKEVLQGAKGIRWEYLYIECSLARDGALPLETLVELVTRQWGTAPRVLYRSESKPTDVVFNVILQMPSQP